MRQIECMIQQARNATYIAKSKRCVFSQMLGIIRIPFTPIYALATISIADYRYCPKSTPRRCRFH